MNNYQVMINYLHSEDEAYSLKSKLQLQADIAEVYKADVTDRN